MVPQPQIVQPLLIRRGHRVLQRMGNPSQVWTSATTAATLQQPISDIYTPTSLNPAQCTLQHPGRSLGLRPQPCRTTHSQISPPCPRPNHRPGCPYITRRLQRRSRQRGNDDNCPTPPPHDKPRVGEQHPTCTTWHRNPLRQHGDRTRGGNFVNGSYPLSIVPNRYRTALVCVHDIVTAGHVVTFINSETIISVVDSAYILRIPRIPKSREWRVPLHILQRLTDLRTRSPITTPHDNQPVDPTVLASTSYPAAHPQESTAYTTTPATPPRTKCARQSTLPGVTPASQQRT